MLWQYAIQQKPSFTSRNQGALSFQLTLLTLLIELKLKSISLAIFLNTFLLKEVVIDLALLPCFFKTGYELIDFASVKPLRSY